MDALYIRWYMWYTGKVTKLYAYRCGLNLFVVFGMLQLGIRVLVRGIRVCLMACLNSNLGLRDLKNKYLKENIFI